MVLPRLQEMIRARTDGAVVFGGKHSCGVDLFVVQIGTSLGPNCTEHEKTLKLHMALGANRVAAPRRKSFFGISLELLHLASGTMGINRLWG